jgi:hypothetical protein
MLLLQIVAMPMPAQVSKVKRYQRMASEVARHLNIHANEVLVCSTGELEFPFQ